MDPAVPRVMIVRNPYSRLLSAYLDKLASQHKHDPSNLLGKHKGQVAAAPRNWRGCNVSAARAAPLANFDCFARLVIRKHAEDPRSVNAHFAPQADKCQWESGYDFYLPVEQMDKWYMPLARALRLVDMLASGWNSTHGDWANHSSQCFYSPPGVSCADFHAGRAASRPDAEGARPESFHATGSDAQLGRYFGDGALRQAWGAFASRDLSAFRYPRWEAGVEAAAYLKLLASRGQ